MGFIVTFSYCICTAITLKSRVLGFIALPRFLLATLHCGFLLVTSSIQTLNPFLWSAHASQPGSCLPLHHLLGLSHSMLLTVWLIKALHSIKQFGFSRKQIQPEFRVPDVYQGVVLESTPKQRRGQRQNWEEGEIQLRCKPDSANQRCRVLRNLK